MDFGCGVQPTVLLFVKPPGRLLERGVNTLQKTLILKKQAELEEVDRELARKRQEFKSYMEALAERRTELKIKQQQVSF